jgi:hypothetical protein
MAKNALEQILAALRGGASDVNARTEDTVAQLATSMSRLLDEAGEEGSKIRRTLVRNWTSLDRPRSSRNLPILIGAVGVGLAAAYMLRRVAARPEPSRG